MATTKEAAKPAEASAKIKLLQSRCGHTADGAAFAQNVGQEIEVGVAEAHRMVDAGQAEFVGKAPERPKD